MTKPFELHLMTGEEVKFLSKDIVTYNNTLLDTNRLNYHGVLFNPLLWPGHRSKVYVDTTKIGSFSVLSLEVLRNIFSYTKIDSLMYLRATNSEFKFLIESWHPFEETMADASVAVKALIATKASKIWTFIDLHSVIYTMDCEFCHRHGEILQMLCMKRVCFNCLTTNRKLLAVAEPYARACMGLSKKECKQVPQLVSIKQSAFWGLPKPYNEVCLDYTTATELAMSKYRTNTRPLKRFDPEVLHIEVKYDLKRESVQPDMILKRTHDPSKTRKPLHVRRLQRTAMTHNSEFMRLPQFLLNPLESNYIQHSCSIFLPARTKPTSSMNSRPINAVLCAGCSYFFNYHTNLPHQTHTLFPHSVPNRPDETRTSTNPSVIHYTHPRTPFIVHLQTCPNARLFWEKLYPTQMNPSPDNPQLLTNGGTHTVQSLRTALETHLIKVLKSNSQHNHFPRHTIPSRSRNPISPISNNILFEFPPERFLTLATHLSHTPAIPPLERELVQKLLQQDPHFLTILSPTNDWRDKPLQNLLSKIATTPPQDTIDHYGNILLTNNSITQTNWATAHVSGSSCLFRGWTGLLLERKRKEEDAAMRNIHWMTPGWMRTKEIEIGGGGWGFDRFGCVSLAG